MDDGVDLPSHLLLPHPDISHGFDDFLKSTDACTHTHTCNPPAPSVAIHSHTCLHTHRQVIASSEELRTPRKPLGNREAVRKYREKKKAHAAFLEEEVKKLRATNQQLLRRLQRHAALEGVEAEVARLRGLLFDVQGKIDAEIGAFPFQKHRSFGSVICTDPTLCFINDDAEVAVAAREESSGPTNFDFEIDESGSISRELDIPEVVNSMDAAASLVNSASLAE
ncbi:basic leucine zipper 23-like [Miscanthus floridulus]|uniref:basic leucine zipper 23-like n=1 Tax=Miscanthus floridulus TaxID=154761 RepID=UPI003458A884